MGISRSENMSRIKGSNTKPEVLLRKALWAAGLRYRLKAKAPSGRPDVVFPGSKVAVFIDGCFWHGCPDHYVRPRSRTEFWSAKLVENTGRDRRQTLALEAAGWRVCRFWEHEVFTDLPRCVTNVRGAIQDRDWTPTPRQLVWLVEPISEDGNQERRHLQMLRDASQARFVEQKRHTRKWKRPKA